MYENLVKQLLELVAKKTLGGDVTELAKSVAAKLTKADERERLNKEFAATPVPWHLALAKVAEHEAPLALEVAGKVEDAEALSDALKSYVARVTRPELEVLPAQETALLERDRAVIELTGFLKAASQHLPGAPDISGKSLKHAAEATLDRLLDGLPAGERIITSVLAELINSSRIELEHWSQQVAVNQRILAALNYLTNRSAEFKGRREPALLVQEGDSFNLQTPITADQAWSEVSVELSHSFSAPQRSERSFPALQELYLEPLATRHYPRLPTPSDAASKVASRRRGEAFMRDHVKAWLANSPNAPFAILGAPGSGKTSYCLWLVHTLFTEWKDKGRARNAPYPIYIRLRHLRAKFSLVTRAESAERANLLLSECFYVLEIDPPPETQRVVLILDGYDELELIGAADIDAFTDALEGVAKKKNYTVVFTGRTVALESLWILIDDRHRKNAWRGVKLCDFELGETGQTRQLVQRWTVACDLHQYEIVHRDKLDWIWRDEKNPFQQLAQIPVLAFFLCSLFSAGAVDLSERNWKSFSSTPAGANEASRRLIEEAIRWRGHPKHKASYAQPEASDSLLLGDKLESRRRQYAKWAWEALRSENLKFRVEQAEAMYGPEPSVLVDFFFEKDGGDAAFLHRVFAEYLAAVYIVAEVVRTGSKMILSCAAAITRGERQVKLDENLKQFIHGVVQDLDAERRALVQGTARDLIETLYRRPRDVPWPEFEVSSTPALIGAAAEIALILWLATSQDGMELSDAFAAAIVLRTYSPRGDADWKNFGPVRKLTGQRLGHTKLNGLNFEGAHLDRVEFDYSSLRGANLQGTKLIGCDFRHADLTGSDFSGASLHGCKLDGARLSQAKLDRADLTEVTGLTAGQLLEAGSIHEALIMRTYQVAETAETMRHDVFWLGDGGVFVRVRNQWYQREETRPTFAELNERARSLPPRVAVGIIWKVNAKQPDERQHPYDLESQQLRE